MCSTREDNIYIYIYIYIVLPGATSLRTSSKYATPANSDVFRANLHVHMKWAQCVSVMKKMGYKDIIISRVEGQEIHECTSMVSL